MKRILSYIAALLLAAAALAGCATTPRKEVTPAPTAVVSETPALSSSPVISPSLTEGYIPDAKDNGGYTPNSGNDLFEDEDYIIFRNRNGILVFDKSANETLAVLPRSKAFTYCDRKVYYIGYDAEAGKRNITEYSVPSGSEKIIIELDNAAFSMLAYNGRLYYAYQTDAEDSASTELRSVAMDGSDMRTTGAKDIDHFVINGNYVYYTGVYTYDGVSYLYKLSLKDGSKKKMSEELSKRYRFEMSGDTLLYPSGGSSIGLYDIRTGKTSFNPVVADWSHWGLDFTILGRYIIFTTIGNFPFDRPSYIRAYDLDSGKLFELAKPDFEYFHLYTTKNGVYISPDNPDGTSLLYKVVISGGKASLKEIINYAPDKKLSSDTVIIASSYGCIRGGYSDGKWLTHSEAAAYCKGKMTFSMYNLVGLRGTVESSGVTCDDEVYPGIASYTYRMPPETWDENAYFGLNIPESNYIEFDYSNDPLCSSYLYYGGKLPDIETVTVTSKINRAVQNLVDDKLGEGKAEANIRVAVTADIDGDGEKETVVNADNCAEVYFGGEDPDEDASKKYWYCLSCIIEGDGAVRVIYDYYFVPPAEKTFYEDSYYYYEDAQFMYVQNIMDIDGDGIGELVLDFSAWEDSETVVYKYDGNKVDEIMWFASWE